jgi:cation:H+ antiporter
MTGIRLLAGFVLLVVGGEALVRGSVAVARRMGLSTLVIGLTLVGFGTSLPELVASLRAALVGSPAIAVGNVIGSNIANTLLILGISAVIAPIAVARRPFRRDGLVLLVTAALLTALVLAGRVERWMAVGLLLLLAIYLGYTYLSERANRAAPGILQAGAERAGAPRVPLAAGLLIAAGGIAAVILGANLLVGAAIDIARSAGISEAVVGLTLVAIGTSLPEIATSVVAAIRGHGDIAFGNAVGSNIFNILGIVGVTASVRPIDVPPAFAALDIWVMLGSAILLVIFALTGRRIARSEGVVLLVAYALYVVVQFAPGLRPLP